MWPENEAHEPGCPFPFCRGFGREERRENELTWYRCRKCGGDFYAERV